MLKLEEQEVRSQGVNSEVKDTESDKRVLLQSCRASQSEWVQQYELQNVKSSGITMQMQLHGAQSYKKLQIANSLKHPHVDPWNQICRK